MKNYIDEILRELYTIDAGFKAHEKELRKLIETALASRPKATLNGQFKANLRRQLLAEAEAMKSAHASTITNTLIELFDMRKIAYFATGAVLTALLVVPVFNYFANAPVTTVKSGMTITKVASNAFGEITNNGNNNAPQAFGLGAGGDAERSAVSSSMDATTSSIAPVPAPAGAGMGVDAKIIVPDAVNYKYVYKGDEVVIEEQMAEVFKRLKGINSGIDASAVLSKINFGLADLKTFANAKVQNISFVQDTDFGYIINANFEEGMIFVNENWRRWPQCNTDECFRTMQMKPDQLPPDEDIIAIADQFMKEHNVDLSGYGSPEVQDYWRYDYERSVDKANYMVGNIISVVYPLQINGKTVYEQDGTMKSGILVTVNLTHRRVSGVSNIAVNNFQSSDYQVASLDKIMSVAEKGGMYSWVFADPTKTVEVEIGTPRLELIRYWNFRNNESEELLVPALIFPVLNQPANEPYFYRQFVTVPIIESILNQDNNNPPILYGGVAEPAVDPAVSELVPTTREEELK